jgi:hypothetical protein
MAKLKDICTHPMNDKQKELCMQQNELKKFMKRPSFKSSLPSRQDEVQQRKNLIETELKTKK